MSKELEALKEARNFRHEKDKNLVVIDIDFFNKCLNGIETALKEYEEHKQILNDYGLSLVDFRHACFTFVQFKNSKGFEGVEKKLKALEIIKEKLFKIDFKYLISSTDYDTYCFFTHYVKGGLTREEYDLLKEEMK